MIASRAASLQPILREVCDEGHARLIEFVRHMYGISEITGPTLRLSPGEQSHFGNERQLICVVIAGLPTGEIMAARDVLTGAVRLPQIGVEIERTWHSPQWFTLLRALRTKFHELTGRELLVPEPVALSQINRCILGQRTPAANVLIFTGQISARTAEGSGSEFILLRNLNLMKNSFLRQCATLAAKRLSEMLPFPAEEAHSFATLSGFSRAFRNQVRSFLRLTPQPHKAWLYKRLFGLLKPGQSVVDLAGGDDELMLRVARHCTQVDVFANDVIWGELERAADGAVESGVTLLNHDIRSFPCAKFDIAVLKNSLHHLRRADDHLAFFDVLPRIARHALIVEIENPIQSALHSFWHRHVYTDDPATDGDAFYTFDQLRDTLRSVFGPQVQSVERIWTARGTYIIAELMFDTKIHGGEFANGIPDDARGRGLAA